MSVNIIGGGPAGISAGLYTLRSGIETRVFTHGMSALLKAEKIENYYGFPGGIDGEELYKRGIEAFKALGGEVIEAEVTGASYTGSFELSTSEGSYSSDFLVIANGAARTAPSIKNLKEFEGRGVSYCAVCDAFFYRGKRVAVIGSGDYALHEAEILEKSAGEVILLTNGDTAPDYKSCDSRKISSIEGKDTVERMFFDDGEEMPIDGIFVAVGVAGGTDIARKLGAVIEGRYVAVDENMATNVPGLYAAGDCTGGLLQIAKAVYEGAKAGLSIAKECKKK